MGDYYVGGLKVIRQYLPILVGGLMVFSYQNCAPLESQHDKGTVDSSSTDGTNTADDADVGDGTENPGDGTGEVPPPVVEPPPVVTDPGQPVPTELLCLNPGAPSLSNENSLIFTVYNGYGTTDSGDSGDQTFRADLGGTSYGQYRLLTKADNDNGIDNVDGAGQITGGQYRLTIAPRGGTSTCMTRTIKIAAQVGANCTLDSNEPSRVSNIINLTVNLRNACMPRSITDGAGIEGQPQFGHDVAIEGNRVVTAAIRDSSNGGFNSYHGSIHIYNKSGTSLTLEKRVVPSDVAAGASDETRREGGTLQAIALSGERIAAGMPRSGNRDGAVYIFDRNGGAWGQTARILPPSSGQQAYFGQSVALEGNRLVVGAIEQDGAGVARGAVYVYTLSNGTWNLDTTLTSTSPINFEHFGSSVAIDNGNIIVGAPFSDLKLSDGPGNAYYFPSGNYGSGSKITGKAVGSQFGKSVDISGNRIIIGAPSVDGGEAYVYDRTNLGSNPIKLQNEDGQFGYDVAIDGSEVLVGSKTNNSSRGATFYYDLNLYNSRMNSGKKAYYQLSGIKNNDQFGTSVAIDGGFGVVGAPLVKVGIYDQSGSIHTYQLDSENYN